LQQVAEDTIGKAKEIIENIVQKTNDIVVEM
jgi:hypothetical protein